MSRLFALWSIVFCLSVGAPSAEESPLHVTPWDGQDLNTGPATGSVPKSLVVVSGACPFEGCQYGRWTARKAVRLYARVDGPLTKRQVRKGEKVTAISGEIHATPRRATVTKVFTTDRQQGIDVGSVVYALYPLGEGAVAVWHDGKTKKGSLDLGLKYDLPLDRQPLKWSWWVKVRLPDGVVGWVQDPREFDGMDRFS